ncbi:MAG: GxxExxY protein [Deltaproteobacteria bacterium]|nr:GxxExxY protein [Deltaproteobacteria bacterium]
MKAKENYVTGEVIDSCVKIHKILGPGLLESVYETVLAFELRSRGFNVALQVPVPVNYEGIRLEVGFRCDMIVNDLVIVELKSVENVLPVHKKQLLTYLKLTGKRLGLLINFNSELMKDGIFRIAN